MKSENTELLTNRLYYFGDVNPEYGGVVCRKLENGAIEAWGIGEFPPISYCTCMVRLEFDADYINLDEVQDAYYNGEISVEAYSDFKFMKYGDWEYTNESNKNCIDQFVRSSYNVWNMLKRYIGVPLHTPIYTYNGKV